MHRRYAALALAAALVVPTGAITAASASAVSSASVAAADRGENDRSNKSGKSTKKAKKAKQGRTVVLGGSVTEVDTEAGTLTFTVQGGRFKKLRGTDLTLSVPDDVRVMREGEQVELAEIQVGDRVNVRARRSDDGFTVIRVIAQAGEDSDDSTEPTESPSPDDDSTTEPTSPDGDESDEDDSTDDGDSADDGSDEDDSEDDSDEVVPAPTPTA